MSFVRPRFLLGFAAGIAATMVSLQVWATCLQRTIVDAAQPRLLLPFVETAPARIQLKSLARPWFPETSSRLHDDWSLRSLNGESVKLSDFKGKAVFLNFVSISCAPCIAEMPGIERLYDSLRNDKVAFMIVGQDDDIEPLRRFSKQHSLSIPVFMPEKEPPPDLVVQGVPTTIILDPEGRAVFRYVGAVNWDDESARAYIRTLVKQ